MDNAQTTVGLVNLKIPQIENVTHVKKNVKRVQELLLVNVNLVRHQTSCRTATLVSRHVLLRCMATRILAPVKLVLPTVRHVVLHQYAQNAVKDFK